MPMQRVRRNTEGVRLDMMPLIDVVFLLLTFFVFAMVLMVRLDISEIRLPVARSGETQLERAPAITVALSTEGAIELNGEPTDAGNLIGSLRALIERTPDADVFIAADEGSSTGDLFILMDTLKEAGITDLRFLRRPGGQ